MSSHRCPVISRWSSLGSRLADDLPAGDTTEFFMMSPALVQRPQAVDVIGHCCLMMYEAGVILSRVIITSPRWNDVCHSVCQAGSAGARMPLVSKDIKD